MKFLGLLFKVICNQWHRLLTNQDGNIGKMLTPPKSKSPWEAMTAGSTGGWAAGIEPYGGAILGLGSALAAPFTGGTSLAWLPGAMSALGGAAGMTGGGYQGSDYGLGENLMGMGIGALTGYGVGALGSGLGGAIQGGLGGGGLGGGLGGAWEGFKGGMGAYNKPLSNFLGGILGGGGQAVGGGMEGIGRGMEGTGDVMTKYFGGLPSGMTTPANAFGQTAGFAGAPTGGASALAPFGGLLSSMGGGGGPQGTAEMAKQAVSQQVLSPASGKGFMEALTNPLALLGMGSMAMSQMSTMPAPPQIGGAAAKWLTSGALTKAGKMAEGAQEEFMGPFGVTKELQSFMDASQSEIEKSYKVRRGRMDTMGQAANASWRTSGERLEMHRRLNAEEQQEVDLMRSQWMLIAKQDHSQKQYKSVMEQLQWDENTKREMLFMDIYDVQAKYQVEMADVLNLRSLFKEAGGYLMQQGMGGA